VPLSFLPFNHFLLFFLSSKDYLEGGGPKPQRPIKFMNKEQYEESQKRLFKQATSLAANSEEFSHLIQLMNPHWVMMLNSYVRQLPEDVAKSTIYGRAIWGQMSEAQQKRSTKRVLKPKHDL
jgi:hypothetical protein